MPTDTEYIRKAKTEIENLHNSIEYQVSFINDRGINYASTLLEEIKNRFMLIAKAVNSSFKAEAYIQQNRYSDAISKHKSFQKYLNKNANIVAQNAAKELQKKVAKNQQDAEALRTLATQEKERLIKERDSLIAAKKVIADDWYGVPHATSYLRSEIADDLNTDTFVERKWYTQLWNYFSKNNRKIFTGILVIFMTIIEWSSFGTTIETYYQPSGHVLNTPFMRELVKLVICSFYSLLILSSARQLVLFVKRRHYSKKNTSENSRLFMPQNRFILLLHLCTLMLVVLLVAFFKAKNTGSEGLLVQVAVGTLLIVMALIAFLLEYTSMKEWLEVMPADFKEKFVTLSDKITLVNREVNFLSFFIAEGLIETTKIHVPTNIKAKGLFITNSHSDTIINIDTHLQQKNAQVETEYENIKQKLVAESQALVAGIRSLNETTLLIQKQYSDFFFNTFYVEASRWLNDFHKSLHQRTNFEGNLKGFDDLQNLHLKSDEYTPDTDKNIMSSGTEELKHQFNISKQK